MIIRTIVDISAVCSEMAFVIFVCTEKRFRYFYKGEMLGFDAFYSKILAFPPQAWLLLQLPSPPPQMKPALLT